MDTRDGYFGRISSSEDFVDTWVTTGHGEGTGVPYSTDAKGDESSGMRIDYAFVDESMKGRVLKAWIDENAKGSDHQPYWIELDYAPI